MEDYIDKSTEEGLQLNTKQTGSPCLLTKKGIKWHIWVKTVTKVNRDRCDQSEESLSKSIFFGLDKNAARENVRKKCAKKLKNAEFLNKKLQKLDKY